MMPASEGLPATTVEVADDLEAVNRLFRDNRWTDGLPIVPPTPARVERMLAGVNQPRHTVVGKVAPAYGAATVEGIAINAVMAGCDPGVLPVLIAAVDAVCDPAFNLQGLQATTNPVAVWLVLNGPVSVDLDANATFNCLGQGNWTNATLGRALRLVLQNIGGALPGEMDRATHGQPGKFTFCCAENEVNHPWVPLHVERGFRMSDSTVTVVGAEGTMNMNTHAKSANELLRVIAETMMHPPSNEYVHGGEPWLVLGSEHAEILRAAGLDKAGVKHELWTRSRMRVASLGVKEIERARASRTSELGDLTSDTLLPISPAAEDIQFIVAGGPGTHSVYVPCFGNSRAVTRRIDSGDS
jgi:hypothetical protein